MTQLKILNLTKSYPAQGPVLSDINIEIENVRQVGIFGVNGSGKTTLLQILSSLIEADQGSILLNGRKVNFEDYSSYSNIVYVPATAEAFHPHLTGMQNLKYWLSFSKKEFSLDTDIISQFDFLNSSYATYSLGMQQVLQYLLAIQLSPQLLLMDEPFRHLDLVNKEKILNLIRSSFKDCILIETGHSPDASVWKNDINFELKNGQLKEFS